MKRLSLLLFLFFALPLFLSAQDAVLVEVGDLLKLRGLLQDTMSYNESVIAQSTELQKIINASETELSGLRLNLTQLQHELESWRSISEAQASEIRRLLPLLTEQDKISKRQAELLGLTLARNKRLKITLIAGIPSAAGVGLLAGWLLSK